MRRSLHDVLGCGRGPLKALAPHTRLLAGTLVFAASMVAPAATAQGSLVVVGLVVAWLSACRPPLRVMRMTVLLGLVLFLPYVLLWPLLPASPTEGWHSAAAILWAIVLRGLSGMLVTLGTIACLDGSDLREALARLPVPRLVSAILLQITHQTATLFHETKSVASAMAVRGASTAGMAAWHILRALPRVWLPRVVLRAERIASVMELRGYCDDHLCSFSKAKTRAADVVALLAAAAALTLSILMRAGAWA